MATSSTRVSQSRNRELILSEFQEITGSNIEDAIHTLHQHNWELDYVLDDHFKNAELKAQSNYDSNLGKFYSTDSMTLENDEDSDRHYATILHLYDDADEWARQEQKQKQKQKPAIGLMQDTPIYHERQRLSRCGLHSLNNLFQIPKLFTCHHLDSIVREYDKRTFFNDYRTLWFGNYDLKILIEAINRCGFDVRQIDIYNGESLYDLPWDLYFGLLVNLNRAHWFTIKNLNGIYHNLDSTLKKPKQIGQRQHLIQYLANLIHQTHIVYLFVVYPRISDPKDFH